MARARRTTGLLAAALVLGMAGAASAAEEPLRIVAFGDSLTAGYGLEPGQGFPARLQAALTDKGYAVEVLDAGVSGDTTAMGLARLDWSIPEDASAVIVELGANDALRGQPPERTRANLEAILDRLSARGLPVLVAGMRAPPNLGPDFAARFDPIFAEVAASHGALFYPFFLDGVAGDPALNQRDGMHPTAEGIEIITARILPEVEELVARASASGE
ncbi:GDSL-type esterase/lipase family protein [Segnochrobactraceae bacterium EtOH-i3]